MLVPLLWFLWSPAGSSAQPHQVVAVAGDAVTLPCILEDRTLFDDSPTVEWTRADLKPKSALVYRDGSEVFEMKHQRFEFRTSLFHSEIKHGNVSLRISDVQLSDAGMFCCLKIPNVEGRIRMENSTVELVVVEDQTGRTRGQLLKDDCKASYATIAGISFMISLSLFGFFLLRNKLQHCARACLPRTMSETWVRRSFQQVRTDSCESENIENCVIEQQERELDNLQSDLQKKDKLNVRLKRPLYSSQQTHVVCHHDKPTIFQNAPTDARNLLESFESAASSSENDQELLENHIFLKSSSFSQKKHSEAEISGLKRNSVPGGKVQRKNPVIRQRSYPSFHLDDDTLSHLPPSSLSGQNNLQRQRRTSLELSASGNDNRKAFDKCS